MRFWFSSQILKILLSSKKKISPGYPSHSPAALPKAPTHYQSERYHSRTAKGVLSNHSQLQWSVRNRSNSPRLPPPPPRRQSPSTPVPPLERNLHESAFSKQLVVPSTEEVLGELRDVTLQYIHFADPTESVARKLRVIQGETENLMANTASNIIAAAAKASSQMAPPPQDTPSIILLPHSSTTDQDMGPAASNASLPSIPAGGKRRGRPPGPKKATANPKIIGGSAKKRIFSKIQASPARQTATPSKAARARARPALVVTNQGITTAVNAPQASLGTPGFHIPEIPLP